MPTALLPLLLAPSAPPTDDGVKILAQSRETIRQVIKLPLYGLTEEEAAQESFFDHALECMDTTLTNMVGRSVSIYPEGEEDNMGSTSGSTSGSRSISGSRASLGSRGGAVPFVGVNPNDGTPLMYVSYVIDFLPLKPFKAPCELIISKASGGRWRHSVLLESTEPEVDDVIVIEGRWAKKGKEGQRRAKKGKEGRRRLVGRDGLLYDSCIISHDSLVSLCGLSPATSCCILSSPLLSSPSRSPVEQHQQCVFQIDQSVRGLRPLHGLIHPRFALRIHLLPQRGRLGTT